MGCEQGQGGVVRVGETVFRESSNVDRARSRCGGLVVREGQFCGEGGAMNNQHVRTVQL